MTLDRHGQKVADKAHGLELRAVGSDLGPPVVVSGATNSPNPVIDPVPRLYGPPVSIKPRPIRKTPEEKALESQIWDLRDKLARTEMALWLMEGARDLLLRVVQEQLPSSALRPDTRGIYFLYKANAIIYVGQSNNIARRIRQHRATIEFDDFRFLIWEDDQIRQFRESSLIALLKPPLNTIHLHTLQDRHAKLTVTM